MKMRKLPEIPKSFEFTSYNKKDINERQNYRPVRTLSNLSKVFEKLIYS